MIKQPEEDAAVMINLRPKNAAIYCRASAERGLFEPEDADILAYQTGSAMAFIRDHNLTFVRLYEDNLSMEGVNDETKDRINKDSTTKGKTLSRWQDVMSATVNLSMKRQEQLTAFITHPIIAGFTDRRSASTISHKRY